MSGGDLSEIQISSRDVIKDNSDDGLLGRGGYGMVYKGEYRGKPVALKVFLDRGGVPNRTKNELLKEARRLKQASDHPYILNMYGVIMEMDNYSLVLEFMKHGTSIELIKQYDVGVPLRVQFIFQIASAMAWLHAKDPPVKHLDLKAENVLIDDKFNAKVSDFGLSVWHTVTGSTQQVNPGNRCGTLTHIPPEVFKDVRKKGSKEEDVYAFAITVWEIFTGKMPYPGINNQLIQQCVLDNQRPDLSALVSQCPQEVRDVIILSWDMEPTKRPTFAEIEKYLAPVYERVKPRIQESIVYLQRQIDYGVINGDNDNSGHAWCNGHNNLLPGPASDSSNPRQDDVMEGGHQQDGVQDSFERLALGMQGSEDRRSMEQTHQNLPNTSSENNTNSLDQVIQLPRAPSETSANNSYSHVPIDETRQPVINSQQDVGLSGFVDLQRGTYIPGHKVCHPRGLVVHPESEQLLSESTQLPNAQPGIYLRQAVIERGPLAHPDSQQSSLHSQVPYAQSGINIPGHDIQHQSVPVMHPYSQQSSLQSQVPEEVVLDRVQHSTSRKVPSSMMPEVTENNCSATQAASSTSAAAAAGEVTSVPATSARNYYMQQSRDGPPPTPQTEVPGSQSRAEKCSQLNDTPPEQRSTETPFQHTTSTPLTAALGTRGVTMDQLSGNRPETTVQQSGRNLSPVTPAGGAQFAGAQSEGAHSAREQAQTLYSRQDLSRSQDLPRSIPSAPTSSEPYKPSPGLSKSKSRSNTPGAQSPQGLNEGGAASEITISHRHSGGGFTTIKMNPDVKIPPNLQIGNNNVMYVGQKDGPQSGARKKQKKCRKSKLTKSAEQMQMDNIDLVAVEIGKDWKSLCRELNMSEADIEHLQFDYHVSGLYEIMYQGIQRWIQRNGREATVRRMAEALWEIDRDDIAQRLK